MPIIYIYTNKTNGKRYIGQTINETERKSRHIYEAMKGGSNTPFHKAIRKYGIDGFEYGILEECDSSILNEREQFWIKELNTFGNLGYNCNIGGGSAKGYKHTPEARAKNSAHSKGNKYCLGFKHSNETKEKLKTRKNRSKAVVQMTLDDNVIAEYKSATEAERVTKVFHIRCVCLGYRPQAGGFKWSYK